MSDAFCTSCRRQSCATVNCYKHQFRVLVVQLFMDRLAIDEVRRFFFIYKLPFRLEDTPQKLRAQMLSHLEDGGFVEKWRSEPGEMRRVLKSELGRDDLAAKVDEFMCKSVELMRT